MTFACCLSAQVSLFSPSTSAYRQAAHVREEIAASGFLAASLLAAGLPVLTVAALACWRGVDSPKQRHLVKPPPAHRRATVCCRPVRGSRFSPAIVAAYGHRVLSFSFEVGHQAADGDSAPPSSTARFIPWLSLFWFRLPIRQTAEYRGQLPCAACER